jgi:hypothetical protein
MNTRREGDEMTGYLPYDANLARLEDLRNRAAVHRAAHREPSPAPERPQLLDVAACIAIRRATEADVHVLQRLAALDGGRPLRDGEMLIAEVGGEAQAAIHVASGAAVADPFRPTAALVELLTLRATRLREAATLSAGRPGLRARLRALYRAA